MADKYAPPFGDYTNVAGIVSAQAAGEIAANIEKLKAFLSKPRGQSMPHPDFDEISPGTRDLLLAEINGLKAAIAAAPAA